MTPPPTLSAPIPLGRLWLSVGGATDPGPVRADNQDRFGVRPPSPGRPGEPALFVVADGMGGHEAGAEASETAVRTLLDRFEEPAPNGHGGDLGRRLADAVRAANAAVWARASTGRFRRMGTTCTSVAFVDGLAVLAHVGDSRAYRTDGTALEQLTRDHTLAEALRGVGGGDGGVSRHALTRAIGIGPEVEVDVVELASARPGDRFVLCSDGLDPVPAEEILRAVTAYGPQEAAEWLVALAIARGSQDNVTALVIHAAPAT